MNLQHALAVGIANYLDAETAPDTKEKVLLTFGIELFLNEFLKLVLILLLAVLLGEFPVVLLSTIYFLLLRRYTGGRHCKTNLKCYMATILTLLVLPILAVNITLPYQVIGLLVVVETILMIKGLSQEVDKKSLFIVFCIGVILGFVCGNIYYMNAMLLVAFVSLVTAVDFNGFKKIYGELIKKHL